ncbi:MAG: hypothetical protein QM526_02180 [Alphaproteobacteria bacterium]|nr:hypothetical protein [Alphaproteobacteria bacterium]
MKYTYTFFSIIIIHLFIFSTIVSAQIAVPTQLRFSAEEAPQLTIKKDSVPQDSVENSTSGSPIVSNTPEKKYSKKERRIRTGLFTSSFVREVERLKRKIKNAQEFILKGN